MADRATVLSPEQQEELNKAKVWMAGSPRLEGGEPQSVVVVVRVADLVIRTPTGCGGLVEHAGMGHACVGATPRQCAFW